MLPLSFCPSCPVPFYHLLWFHLPGPGNRIHFQSLDDKNHNMMTMSFVNWDKQKRDVSQMTPQGFPPLPLAFSVYVSCKNKINISIFHVFTAATTMEQPTNPTYHSDNSRLIVSFSLAYCEILLSGKPQRNNLASQSNVNPRRENSGSFSW